MKNKFFKYFSLVFLLAISIFSFGCKQNVFNGTYILTSSKLPFFVSVERTKNIKDIIGELELKVVEFENNFDTKKEDSLISIINNAKAKEKIKINKAFYDLFYLSKHYYDMNLNFNPALYPIIKLWGLDEFDYLEAGSEIQTIPSDEEIENLLPICKMENFAIEEIDNEYYISKEYDKCELDFGGIAKGYFTDLMIDFVGAQGVKNMLLNYAGNLMYSVKKNMYIPDIYVTNAVKEKKVKLDLKRAQFAVITSGHYQRFYTYNGEIISHILNKDGKQGSKELSGVTIIDSDGAKCDVFATIACSLTKEAAICFLNEQNVLYLLIDKDGNEIKNF